MANKWIEHVKKFASDNNVAYACAISDPRCKSSYEKPTKKDKIDNVSIKASKIFIIRYKEASPEDKIKFKSKFNLLDDTMKKIIKDTTPNIYNKLTK